ncbi:RNA polymerase III transcription factor (TF)IIIC subunit HTH domain containing protein, putative [Angomonas deanei]|uniref:RNA polymerase III transcription factor (TF)IIIC subunit HTH domain containing protein, putative n=1 Tax=Angomonas deanei TaxID=59799 RepID=A0A7G2CNU3_9TRYP|nr:RNA polymerase III transcription factor (TF)IIIC subunit HTH domain containing protein, putative [Angomonas deanei]
MTKTQSLPVDNIPNNNEEDENANENLTVSVTASLPPERTAAQLVVLRDSFHASPTGLSPNDPTEVRTFVLLLYLHPVWSAKLLERLCTRCMPLLTIHAIKRMTFAYTYSVERGPFHRLRLRYNFNPYEGEQYSNNVKKVNIKDSLFCQLNSLRIHRTSPLGVRVRDLARSPQLAHVIALIRRVNYETAKAALQSAAEDTAPVSERIGRRCRTRNAIFTSTHVPLRK